MPETKKPRNYVELPRQGEKQYKGYIDYIQNGGMDGFSPNYEIGTGTEVKYVNDTPLPARVPIPGPSSVRAQTTKLRTNKTIIPGTDGKMREMSLHFDGKKLTTRINDGNQIRGYTYPAYAGHRNSKGEFDYSRERQKVPNDGPIPEGNYWIDPQEIQRFDDLSIIDKIVSNEGFGNGGIFPGGTNAWGSGRVWINPRKIDVDGVQRRGMTIHGGVTPGSSGCIDITCNIDHFLEQLERYRGGIDSIPLRVDYSGINREK